MKRALLELVNGYVHVVKDMASHHGMLVFLTLGDLKWSEWVLGIWSSFMVGGSGAIGTVFGALAYNAITAKWEPFRALMVKGFFTFVIGGLIHMFVYINSNPVPEPVRRRR